MVSQTTNARRVTVGPGQPRRRPLITRQTQMSIRKNLLRARLRYRDSAEARKERLPEGVSRFPIRRMATKKQEPSLRSKPNSAASSPGFVACREGIGLRRCAPRRNRVSWLCVSCVRGARGGGRRSTPCGSCESHNPDKRRKQAPLLGGACHSHGGTNGTRKSQQAASDRLSDTRSCRPRWLPLVSCRQGLLNHGRRRLARTTALAFHRRRRRRIVVTVERILPHRLFVHPEIVISGPNRDDDLRRWGFRGRLRI